MIIWLEVQYFCKFQEKRDKILLSLACLEASWPLFRINSVLRSCLEHFYRKLFHPFHFLLFFTHRYVCTYPPRCNKSISSKKTPKDSVNNYPGLHTYHAIIWRSLWGPLRGCVRNPIILVVFRRDTGN